MQQCSGSGWLIKGGADGSGCVGEWNGKCDDAMRWDNAMAELSRDVRRRSGIFGRASVARTEDAHGHGGRGAVDAHRALSLRLRRVCAAPAASCRSQYAPSSPLSHIRDAGSKSKSPSR